MMRIAGCVVVAALIASNAWARLGDTAQEAEKRFGPPERTWTNNAVKTVSRSYTKGGMRIEAHFFRNKSGKTVIGRITYEQGRVKVNELPTTPTTNATAQFFQKLLEANANGETWTTAQERHGVWEVTHERDSAVSLSQQYMRKGAKAECRDSVPASMTATLDEYTDYMNSQKAENDRKTKEVMKKDMDGF
jgi:hypothetical protein